MSYCILSLPGEKLTSLPYIKSDLVFKFFQFFRARFLEPLLCKVITVYSVIKIIQVYVYYLIIMFIFE